MFPIQIRNVFDESISAASAAVLLRAVRICSSSIFARRWSQTASTGGAVAQW